MRFSKFIPKKEEKLFFRRKLMGGWGVQLGMRDNNKGRIPMCIRWSVLIGTSLMLCVTHVFAAEGDKPSAVGAAETQTMISRISEWTQKAVDQEKAIDIYALCDTIGKLTKQVAGLDETARSQFIADLGKLLVNYRSIKDVSSVLRGIDPRDSLWNSVMQAIITLDDRRAAPYLVEYYKLRQKQVGGWSEESAARIAALIKKFGGEVPAPPTKPSRRVDRDETTELLRKLTQSDLSSFDMTGIFQRLRKVGDERAAAAIAEKVSAAGIHSLPKQEGIRALGQIGGPTAIAALVKELERPAAEGAKIEDDSNVDAIVRGQAAMSLGQCGDLGVLPLLDRVVRDGHQFLRVRYQARFAIKQILKRNPRASLPALTSSPAVDQENNRKAMQGILARFNSTPGVNWDKVQAVKGLTGFFDGPEVQAFLIGLLERPMPPNTDLENSEVPESAIRVEAAKGLGQLADGSVLPMLKRINEDPKQFKRVRDECANAMATIRSRAVAGPNGN